MEKADTCTITGVHTHLLDSPTDQVIVLLYSSLFPLVALDNGRRYGLGDGAQGGREEDDHG